MASWPRTVDEAWHKVRERTAENYSFCSQFCHEGVNVWYDEERCAWVAGVCSREFYAATADGAISGLARELRKTGWGGC